MVIGEGLVWRECISDITRCCGLELSMWWDEGEPTYENRGKMINDKGANFALKSTEKIKLK